MNSQGYTDEDLANMLREARDPATPPDRLRAIRLTEAGDANKYPIKEAIAANPNTPVELLPSLASAFPEAFCANPAAALVLLEAPDFVLRMHQRRGLLRCGNAPFALVDSLNRHGKDRTLHEEARLHIALAGEVPDGEWASAIRDYWKEQAARATKWQRAGYAELVVLADAPAWIAEKQEIDTCRARLLRAMDPATPLTELEAMWLESWPASRSLHELGVKEDRLLWYALYHNPSLPRRNKELPSGEVLFADPVSALAAYRQKVWTLSRSAGLPLTNFLWMARPDVPAAEGQRTARKGQWYERLGTALSLNPKYRRSAEALSVLAEEGNRLVRAAARARLRGEIFSWEADQTR